MAITDQTTSAVTEADTAEVAGLTQRIVAAWAAHDADAFAGVFVEDGTMILPGVFQKGRDQIRAFMAAAFEGPYKGTQVTGQPFDLRFLGSDVAVLLTKGGVLAPGETEVPEERGIRATWLAAKQDGQWLLAAYQNTPLN
ncbi:SgcJ/EcaC family oxidoreductase [Micromonospora sp. NPDC049523]|uniref:SgcJ/EcaC family oxidoreductase n=1 Tax=Micromonospora sp. NPDC049523 TaxID=3155921 RepID=UPI003418394D